MPTPLPSSGSQDAEFAAAFNSATRESGLKFSGDWRIALRELRELIHLTQDIVFNLPPSTSSSSAPSADHQEKSSRIPISPRSLTQQEAHEVATADAITEEMEEGTDFEAVPEKEDGGIEDGWNEVDAEMDHDMPPEDEESVVV